MGTAPGLAKHLHHCHLTMAHQRSSGGAKSLVSCLILMAFQLTSPMELMNSTLVILQQRVASGKLDGLLFNQLVISQHQSRCEHMKLAFFLRTASVATIF